MGALYGVCNLELHLVRRRRHRPVTPGASVLDMRGTAVGFGAGLAFVLAMVGGLVVVATTDGAAVVLLAAVGAAVAGLAGWALATRLAAIDN
jgi:hypothetical protein